MSWITCSVSAIRSHSGRIGVQAQHRGSTRATTIGISTWFVSELRRNPWSLERVRKGHCDDYLNLPPRWRVHKARTPTHLSGPDGVHRRLENLPPGVPVVQRKADMRGAPGAPFCYRLILQTSAIISISRHRTPVIANTSYLRRDFARCSDQDVQGHLRIHPQFSCEPHLWINDRSASPPPHRYTQ